MSNNTDGYAGIFPAIITPFTDTDKINEKAFRKALEFNVKAGVHGFWVCGGTGESILLDDDEIAELAKIAVDQVRGRAKLIMHVGTPTTRRSAKLAERVSSAGVDAICAVPPFFYVPPEQQIIDHYKAIAESANLPLFIYNLPSATQVEITPQFISKIKDSVPLTIGLKHSSPNLFATKDYVEQGMVTFIGSGGLLLQALTMGAAGCVDGPPCVIPEDWVAVYDSYKNGDYALAESQMKILSTKQTFFSNDKVWSKYLSLVKTILSARIGIDCGQPRHPIPQLTDTEKTDLLVQARQLGII